MEAVSLPSHPLEGLGPAPKGPPCTTPGASMALAGARVALLALMSPTHHSYGSVFFLPENDSKLNALAVKYYNALF